MVDSKPKLYRDFIDELVRVCHSGQGQIGPDRVRGGTWNPHITENSAPDQHAMNLLLAKLNANDRETIASFLAQAFKGGVFETLKALEAFQISPFEEGYEGSPYHDFIGRVSGEWEWPEQ
ncbi:hypothetical protein LJC22_02190 [Desulfosarcina sp. OttesenSCG-928-G10]|nr:hypothetical protein [Desulfosarcina sp. OttesenSCG-928-G10]MDL2322344.1 hypothetical protein [Desulfosarcina sp. OttesenSCG-928-B08]